MNDYMLNIEKNKLIIGLSVGILGLALVILGANFSYLLAFGVLVGILMVISILAKPETGLYFIAAVIPIGRYTVPGLPFYMTMADGLIIIALFSLILRKLVYEKRYKLITDKIFVLLILFTLFSGLSIYNSLNKMSSFFEFIQTIEYFVIIPYLIFDLTKNIKQVRNILWILVVFCGLFSLYGIYEGLVLGMRSMSIAGHANAFGIYLAMIIPITYALFLSAKNKSKKVILIGILGLSGAALLLTLSRAGWLAAIIAILIINFKVGIKRSLIVGLSVLLIFIATSHFYMPDQVKERFKTITSGAEDTSGGRIEQYENALEMVKMHPFLGVGLNEAIRYNEVVETKGGPKIRAEMHNVYLAIASERGLIALVFFLSFVLIYLVSLWRNSTFTNIYGVYFLAMLASSVAFLFGNMFHNSVGRGNGNLFMMIVGMALALQNLYKRDYVKA